MKDVVVEEEVFDGAGILMVLEKPVNQLDSSRLHQKEG